MKGFSVFTVNLAALLCLCTLPIQANADCLFKKNLDAKIDALFPTAHVGLVIKNAQTNELVYAHQADKFFAPASTVKLFTSYAALRQLGEDYRFETELKFDPTKINAQGVLNDDVVLSFSGDPSFTDLNLAELLLGLKDKGVRQVNGKIWVENHGFSAPHLSPGATWDTWSYYPPVSSIVINENTVLVKLEPSTHVNKPCLASLVKSPGSADLTAVTLSHNITTVSEKQAEQSCSLEANVSQKNAIQLSGCWPINATGSILSISLASPEKALEKKVLALLKHYSIGYKKSELYFTDNLNAKPNAKLETVLANASVPLKDLIKPLLLNSNNLYADSLHKKLGENALGMGSYAYGVQAQQAILKKSDISISLKQQFDGSGASRYNLMSPNQLAHLLSQVYQDKPGYLAMKNALPVAGMSGTLKNRFKTENTAICQNKIWAKTGTLKNISALAGYIDLDNNQSEQYVFALMVQGEALKLKEVKAKEDALLADVFRLLSKG